ncbi:hypothetical protein EPK99_17515 [Neorhizobium lilium]|uniref:Uncharacterized protein n=1 Tax=Neorhizobium lilium TaxID=2503024 RepID=A0A444LCB8_9HYPH|nr:hypothetical protein [Neorhizobium lilium]RWX75500.1 hypothetical protein EPK99_17515 [Neorhizobium lilium]
MTLDSRAVSAAANNADLYRCVFEAHGLRYALTRFAFIGLDPPPPYYSNLTTLTPHDQPEQAECIATLRSANSGSFGFKDSFSNFDMSKAGMTRLFEAAWLWAPAAAVTAQPLDGWKRIKTDDDLNLWEAGWKAGGSPSSQRMFPATMLSRPDIGFYGRFIGATCQAGCIANLSGDCVGLSNIYSVEPGRAQVRASAARCAANFAPGRPVVGYDRGNAFETMVSIGFEPVGKLIVWVDPPSRSMADQSHVTST